MPMYQSQTARTVAMVVFGVLFCAQIAMFLPSVFGRYVASGESIELAESGRLETALRYAGPTTASAAPESLLTSGLLSLELTRPDGSVLLSVDSRDPAGEFAITEGDGPGRAVNLRLTTLEGPMVAHGWVSLHEQRATAWREAAVSVLIALLVSLMGAGATIFAVSRHFLTPLAGLVGTLRAGREASAGNLPSIVELDTTQDLHPLADEFNQLVDAQKKAARQVKVKQQYLEFAAHHDPLTHLPNRLMFEDTLKSTVKRAVAEDLQFAVFLVDLDNFKFFNDQYGHLIGDKMVAEVGNRLKTMMRDVDLVARLDGDEFVVIQKDVPDRDTATAVAERLMKVATAPYEYRGFTLKAAVSVGISCFPLDVHEGQDEELLGEEIVNNAAVALQEAKSGGKNQSQLFNDSMRSRLTARIRLEQDLKIAIAEEQFEVWFQPKINIQTRQVTGSEALVRWRHPVNGFISPEVFVPVAEEAGLIIELGEWILRTACRQTYELQERGYTGLNVAVNISAVQFTDGNLLPMVRRALVDTSLAPSFLELEITESAVMHDPEEVILSLHELSRYGMRLAIDDFGTGYSSLAYLKRFPVDTLKIDRAFITDISSDNDDVAIVEAVLGLGKHFNMKVVAEGVEDEEQLQFLKQQGCDIAQGFYISRPMAFKQYVDWLQRWPHGVVPLAAKQEGDGANVLPIAPHVARRAQR
jgi:diguanylate cyclase (GGDEF)-like protein